MLKDFIFKQFGSAMIITVIALLFSNMYSCFKGNRLEEQLTTAKHELAVKEHQNHGLEEQIKLYHNQIEDYQHQLATLHDNVLTQLKQSEERSNALLSELEKHKAWADTAVPDSIKRVFNQRDTRSATQSQPAAMSAK